MANIRHQIVLSNEDVSDLVESSPELREQIIERFVKVFDDAVKNTKCESETGTN